MARIVIAETPEGSATLKRITQGHDQVIVHTMKDALSILSREKVDLVIVSLHFDDSQMFELVRDITKGEKNSMTPIICFCSRNTDIARIMHESLELTTRMLGAWMYLNEHAYNVYKDPAAELRRVIDRCLTNQARKDTLQIRVHIQSQRAEIQRLRVMMESQDWSPEMNDYLHGLRHDLDSLLSEVESLQESAENQRASVASSRALKDRVSEQVTLHENGMTTLEQEQYLEESEQTAAEVELARKEQVKLTLGRQKQTSD